MRGLVIVVVMGSGLVIGCGGDDAGSDSGNVDSGGSSDASSIADAMPGLDAVPSFDAARPDGGVDAGNMDAGCIDCDGGAGTADAAVPAACDPVAQVGCQAGEKCSWLVLTDVPFIAITTCVPDGVVAIGGACIEGAPGPDTGYDDCVAGNLCTGGECQEICGQFPDTCAQGESCISYADTFTDVDSVGLCNPECDVMIQDCVQDPSSVFGTGCYISLVTGNATCANAYPETMGGMPGGQGDVCNYLNTCTVGYGCTLINDPINPTENTCAKFCDPMLMGGPICDDTGAASSCVQINMFYGDADNVADEVGFCVDCALWSDVPACM